MDPKSFNKKIVKLFIITQDFQDTREKLNSLLDEE